MGTVTEIRSAATANAPSDRMDDVLGSQSTPDTLLPDQYYGLRKRRHWLEGERKLMFAVLEDAVECFLKNIDVRGHRRRVLFCEAQRWINARNAVGPFSFDNVCEILGIEPTGLRKALERRRLQHKAGSIRQIADKNDRATNEKRRDTDPG